ncbi:MAG TPA: type II toxin-antitoxin system VapC family toxin [Blastocatellia bacterium]|nr:type II toxin-antitoxin system VapC family toxin [Blastocatellia bacterium]
MPSTILDTSVIIAFKPNPLPGSPFCVVVIQELMAGASDGSELRYWEATAKKLEKEKRLLVPTTEDWLLAGRVLNLLLRGLRSRRDGRTPKMHPDEKQRIIRDVLIARCVRRVNGLLVTNNLKDFERITKFCDVRLQSGSEFFSL